MMNVARPCPCGSKRTLEKCCGRFLSGEENPKTPEQLMRSRYTAHVLGGQGEYLVATWLLAKDLGLTAASFEEHRVNWQRLDVLAARQQGNEGWVEFKAWFLPAEGGELQVHHEHSLFRRQDGTWYYVEALT